MFHIIVAVKNSPNNFRAAFKEEGTAMAALENIRDRRKNGLSGTVITVKGDYGQIIDIEVENIGGVLFMDVEKENIAHMEGELLKARAGKKLNDALRGDPVLNLAAHGVPDRLSA